MVTAQESHHISHAQRVETLHKVHFRVNSAAKMFSEEIRKVEAQEPNAVGIYPNVRRDARETQRGTQACIEDH